MCKIIIADDEYLERDFFKKIIGNIENAAVVGEVNCGRKAVEFCAALKPELIFLNVHMGGVNGVDAARQIREFNKDVAIVLTSGTDEKYLKLFIRDLGIDDYLLKPIKPAKIEEIVKSHSKSGYEFSVSIPRGSKKKIKYYPLHLMSPSIKNALLFIDGNISGNLSLDSVAQAVYLSTYYFSRLFKKEVGVTFSSYVTHKKIDEAKRMLESTNKSIVEISTALSFKEQNYFCRVFKRHVGSTPTQYRFIVTQKITERKTHLNNYTV